jgi:hypothetical protein
VTVWSSVRAAVSATADTLGRFLLVNLVWLVIVVLTVPAAATFPPLYVLTLATVPIMCGITRMAGHAARGDLPRLRHFRDGARHRLWAHLAIGAGQGLVLVIAVVNIGVGMGGDSLLFALITVVAGYVALLTVVFAVAVWPLLLDPERADLRVAAVFRLALAVALTRPVRLAVIALVEIVLAAGIAEFVVLGALLPSFGALVAANFVLPVADDLRSDGRRAYAAQRLVDQAK